MRKDLLILLAILIPLAAIMILVANRFSPQPSQNSFISPTPYPTISEKSSDENLTTLTPSTSKNIEVLSPRTGDSVRSGFAVRGNARVFENVVSIRLRDSSGNILVETTTDANAPDVGLFGPFEKVISFQTLDSLGSLEVYQVSAKDGSEVDKVTIPLVFK